MRPRYFVLTVMLLSLLASCSGSDQPSGIEVPQDMWNQEVRVFAPVGLNTFRIGDSIGLVIAVTGTREIAFPADSGVKVFLYRQRQWTQVETAPVKYPQEDCILPPSRGDPFLWEEETRVYPLLPTSDSPLLLRIFVFGRVYQDGIVTTEKVGAYTDVVLRP